MDQTEFKQSLLGLCLEEAERRLRHAGTAFSICELYGKKGPMEGADGLRVIRCREEGETLALLVSAFRTLPEAGGEEERRR